MGWYKKLKQKTKGLKNMSKDIGRILSGDETSKALDNADKAADIYVKVAGGPEGATAESAASGVGSGKSKSKKSKKKG